MPGMEVAEMMNTLADPGVMGDSYKKKEKKPQRNTRQPGRATAGRRSGN